MKQFNTLSSFLLRNIMLRIYLVGLILLISSTSYSTIIVQENFDAFTSGWHCTIASPVPQGIWTPYNSCYVSVAPSTYNISVTSPGNGGSGKAFTNQYSSSVQRNTYSTLHHLNPPWPSNCKEIYQRFYMKIDTNLDKSIASTNQMKFWRYYVGSNPADQIYFCVGGSTLKTGTLELKVTGQSYGTLIKPLSSVSSIQDGNWHSVEIHIKLNSSASASDGVYDFWIDGTHVSGGTNIQWVNDVNPVFRSFAEVGVGNVSDEAWSNTSPGGIYWDDYILSTTYNGPIGGGGTGDTTPPTISNGSPSGTLSSGTTSTNMTVTTNEAATCKYGTSDVAYSSLLNTFTTTGSTSHSQTLSGLTNDGPYNYYVRCIDGSDNVNTSSTVISFSALNPVLAVNGACGTASGSYFASLTSSSPNLCATGTVASFIGTGPWTWGCNGSGGGSSTASKACSAPLSTATPLLSEDFEDTNFSSRGWYDGGTCDITTSQYQNGTHAAQFIFANGASTPSSPYAGAMRRLFTASDAVYLDYYVKYPSGWQEQTYNYGHHEIHIATDADGAYVSPAFSHTTAYIENWGTSGASTPLTPHMQMQDGANIDQSKINVDLIATTENRSANGCNGLPDSSFFDYVMCYDAGAGTYWNGMGKGTSTGAMSLNEWHHVQAYFKMNTVTSNKGNADGTMAYWLDGVQQFRSDSLLFRTNQHATMKFNQFIIAPYMGNGSPRAQAFYIDNLKVYNSIPSDSSGPAVPTITIQSVTNP